MESAFDPVYGKRTVDYDLAYVSYYIEDGDYWKVDNVTLGYTLGDAVLGPVSDVLNNALDNMVKDADRARAVKAVSCSIRSTTSTSCRSSSRRCSTSKKPVPCLLPKHAARGRDETPDFFQPVSAV